MKYKITFEVGEDELPVELSAYVEREDADYHEYGDAVIRTEGYDTVEEISYERSEFSNEQCAMIDAWLESNNRNVVFQFFKLFEQEMEDAAEARAERIAEARAEALYDRMY